MKILNLYAGIGGNRKLWGEEHEITAVEIDPEIAKEYQKNFPKDKVVVADAHQYLLEHFEEFDFIWSSPPCPTHSKLRFALKEKKYPEMKLYEEIIFLTHWFKGDWVVENVIPYYKTLIRPQILGRHCFWSNFNINPIEHNNIDLSRSNKEQLAEDLGMEVTKRLWLRNCVHPKVGLHILKSIN